MGKLWGAVRRFRDAEFGASTIEYSILVMLVAIVTLVALTVFGENVSSNLDNTATRIAELG